MPRPRSVSAEALALFGGTPAVSALPDRWPHITEPTRRRVLDALDSGRLGYGESCVTRDFEEAFAAYHGRKYAIALNSGTVALAAAYHGCGLGRLDQMVRDAGNGRGTDEVVVCAYGFFATASALLWLGLVPRFCDADEATRSLDPTLLAAATGAATGAVCVTHVAGHIADMGALAAQAAIGGLDVIEDASHAHGARRDGRLAGTFGRAAAFSTQSAKMLTGGEGGVLLTDDDEVFARAADFGNFRRLHGTAVRSDPELAETGLGLKLRMGPLEAALAHAHLDRLDDLIEARGERLRLLSQRLAEGQARFLSPPHHDPSVERGAFYEYHLGVSAPEGETVEAANAALRRLLVAEGVRLPHSNTKAISRLPILARFAGGRCFPVAERLEAATICLPTFTTEPFSLVEDYATALLKVDRALPDALVRLRPAAGA